MRIVTLPKDTKESADAVTRDQMAKIDKMKRRAPELLRVLRSMGAAVRSFKHLKGTITDLSTCVSDGPFSDLVFDGLFFSLWSSEFSDALELTCWRADRADLCSRCYWTKGIEPIHTFYMPKPLRSDEVEELIETREWKQVFVHSIAMSLLPWKAAVHWQLLIEAYQKERGDTEAQEQLKRYVKGLQEPPSDVLDSMGEAFPALNHKRSSIDLGVLGDRNCIMVFLPFEVTDEHWQRLYRLYTKSTYNRSSCIDVEMVSSGELRIAIKPETVENTYDYLRTTDADLCALEEISSSDMEFEELLDRTLHELLQGMPLGGTTETVPPPKLDVLFAARREQREYLRRVSAEHPDIAKAAVTVARDVSGLLTEGREWIRNRIDNIIGFVEGLAQVTTQTEPILLHRRIREYESGKTSVLVIPISSAFTTQTEQQQHAMPVHLYHLCQPGELLKLIDKDIHKGILQDGGGVAVER